MRLYFCSNLVRPALFMLICSISCTRISAQLSIGIEGGYNKNTLLTNNDNRTFTHYRAQPGFSIGIPIQYKISDWLSVAATPSYIQKNYRQDRFGFSESVYQNTNNSYLQLPLMAQGSFGGERLRGFANAGIYFGYWINSYATGVMTNILNVSVDSTGTHYQQPFGYQGTSQFDKRKDNRLEIGWVAGLGISYSINSRYSVYTEARLLYGITDQQKNYMINQVPRYNTNKSINAGILYSLNSKTANN